MSITLPSFVCVGSSKCGTTSLYEYLKKHPGIFLPEQKELHYFSYRTLIERPNGPGTKYVLADIIKSESEYKKLFERVPLGKVSGDVSPSYLSSPIAVREIRRTLDAPKIIIMLRNPVDKVFSQFLHLKRAARENLSFEDAIEAENSRACNGWGDMWLYQRSGFYFEDVKRYADEFGLENIHVIISEKFRINSAQELSKLFDFLGLQHVDIENSSKEYNKSALPKYEFLAKLSDSSFSTYVAKKIIPRKYGSKLKQFIQNANLGDKPVLNDKTRIFLEEQYRNDIENLESLLDIKTHWI